jgi:hypothetical protein
MPLRVEVVAAPSPCQSPPAVHTAYKLCSIPEAKSLASSPMAKSCAAGFALGPTPLQWNWAMELRDALEEIKAADISMDADIAALGRRIAADGHGM